MLEMVEAYTCDLKYFVDPDHRQHKLDVYLKNDCLEVDILFSYAQQRE